MNYYDALVQVADDCPTTEAQVPQTRGGKKTKAVVEYELLASHPYTYTEEDIAFGQPCAIERWPDVPTRVIAGRDDRFFPLDFQRRVAGERLGAEVDEVPGGHLAALSRPAELAGHLTRYL